MMIKNLQRRIIHEMNKPITKSSDLSVALVVTSSIFSVFILVFGFNYLIDYFEIFVNGCLNSYST